MKAIESNPTPNKYTLLLKFYEDAKTHVYTIANQPNFDDQPDFEDEPDFDPQTQTLQPVQQFNHSSNIVEDELSQIIKSIEDLKEVASKSNVIQQQSMIFLESLGGILKAGFSMLSDSLVSINELATNINREFSVMNARLMKSDEDSFDQNEVKEIPQNEINADEDKFFSDISNDFPDAVEEAKKMLEDEKKTAPAKKPTSTKKTKNSKK